MFYDELYKPVKSVFNAGYGSTTKFTVRTKPNADLKLEANGERKESGATDASLKWIQTFRNRGIGYTVTGKLDVEGTVDVGVNATGLAKGLGAGIETKVQVYPVPQKQSELLKEVNFGLRYSALNYHVVTQLDKFENLKVGVAQTINPRLTLAGEFSHNLKHDANNEVQRPVFGFGADYAIDADSSVAGKVNTNGVVNAAYKVRVNPSIFTTLAFETNVNDLSKRNKVGVSFDINA